MKTITLFKSSLKSLKDDNIEETITGIFVENIPYYEYPMTLSVENGFSWASYGHTLHLPVLKCDGL